jgi:hypothetical protein
MLKFLALYWPQGLKKDIIKFEEPICKPWANVPALNNKLRPNNKPKMLKAGPKFFQP